MAYAMNKRVKKYPTPCGIGHKSKRCKITLKALQALPLQELRKALLLPSSKSR